MARKPRRMSPGKRNNFSISNYINLTVDHYLEDAQNYKLETQRESAERALKKLEADFYAKSGYMPQEFAEAILNNSELLKMVYEFFNMPSIVQMYNLTGSYSSSGNKSPQIKDTALNLIKKYVDDAKTADIIVATGRVMNLSTALNNVFGSKHDTATFKVLVNDLESIKDFGAYDDFVNKLGAGKEAQMATLIEEILNTYKNSSLNDENDTVKINNFSLTDLDNVEKNWADLKKEFSKKNLDLDKIRQKMNGIRNIINRTIKGKNLGELASQLIMKDVFKTAIANQAADIVVSHVGNSVSSVSDIYINILKGNKAVVISESNNYRAGKVMSLKEIDALKKSGKLMNTVDLKFDNKIADLSIKIPKGGTGEPTRIGLQKKTLDLNARKVKLLGSEKMTVGTAISLGGSGALADYGGAHNTETTRAFFNAMNTLLADRVFRQDSKNKFKIRSSKKNNPYNSVLRVDQAFGGILTRFGFDVFTGYFRTENAGLLDINGAIIPAPLYFQYCIDNFFAPGKKTMTIANLVGFKSGNTNYARTVMSAGTRDEGPQPGENIHKVYLALTLKRNATAIKKIMENKITLNAYFVKPEDVYNILHK